jgi:hypothetical protein
VLGRSARFRCLKHKAIAESNVRGRLRPCLYTSCPGPAGRATRIRPPIDPQSPASGDLVAGIYEERETACSIHWR